MACISKGTGTETGNYFEVSITNTDNDGYWPTYGTGGNVITSTSRFGRDDTGFTTTGFYLFENIDVPTKAVINKAIIEFTAASHHPSINEDCFVTIYGVDSNNPTAPAAQTRAPSLPKTSNALDWLETNLWVLNNTYETPDIACVVQELIDISGSGQNMMFLFEGDYFAQDGQTDPRFPQVGNGGTTLKIWWDYPNPEGGCVVGGSANISSISTFTPIASGLKISLFSIDTEFPSGGIILGGSALIEVNSVNVYMSSELDGLPNESNKISEEIDNTVGLYLFEDLELFITDNGTHSPISGGVVDIYLLASVDGTNFPDGDDAIDPGANAYVGSFVTRPVSTNQRMVVRRIPLPPLKYKYLLINKTGMDFNSTGNTLTGIAYTYSA